MLEKSSICEQIGLSITIQIPLKPFSFFKC